MRGYVASLQPQMNEILPLLEKLANADGTSGNEHAIRELLKSELMGVSNEVHTDPMGNLVAVKSRGSGSPKIMLASHMDEVGLVIKYIRPDGYIGFELSGLIDPRILASQWVRIHTSKDVIRGVIGVPPGHFAEQEVAKPSPRSMWIDIGADSKDKVLSLGIRVGDFATYDRKLMIPARGEYVIGKALDNRVGCTVMVNSFRAICEGNYPCNVFAVAPVMEEIGALGARVAANNVRPDIAIVLDGLPASDPSVSIEQTSVEVGHGVVIRRSETDIPNGNVTPKWLMDLALHTAEESGIPYQVDVSTAFFSDASAITISGQGIPTIPILVPRRNSHSPAEIASTEDIKHAIELAAALAERLSGISSSLKEMY